jgi:hypothetical protein
LNAPLAGHIRDDMRSVHAKFHESRMHRGGDTNLFSFSFLEFCTLEEQELGRIAYMKDVVLYETVPTKFVSSFLSSILFHMNFQTSGMDKYKKNCYKLLLLTA